MPAGFTHLKFTLFVEFDYRCWRNVTRILQIRGHVIRRKTIAPLRERFFRTLYRWKENWAEYETFIRTIPLLERNAAVRANVSFLSEENFVFSFHSEVFIKMRKLYGSENKLRPLSVLVGHVSYIKLAVVKRDNIKFDWDCILRVQVRSESNLN